MNQTQQNAIKIWTGIPYTWTNKFHHREDNTWIDIIKPFYKPNTTERERDWVATILSPRDTQIDEKKHDAIGFCLSMVAVEILRGSIKYDTEDIFKLKRHSEEHNCQVMLYEEIQDTINRAKSLTVKDNDPNSPTYGQEISRYSEDSLRIFEDNANEFSNRWRQDMLTDIKTKMQVLKSFQTDDEIFQLLNTLTLDQTVSGKVEQYKPGKFRFLTGFQEGLQLEFKQSVFSPNLTEIKNIKDTNVYNREKNKLEWNLKYRIIGSACALLNTEGGEIYIGVDDKTGNIVGLSDDQKYGTFSKQKHYFKFLDDYKSKVYSLLMDNILGFKKEYVGNMEYSEFRDAKRERINILCIPCKMISRSGEPVYLKKKHDDDGNPSRTREILYERVQASNKELQTREAIEFLQGRFPESLKHG